MEGLCNRFPGLKTAVDFIQSVLQEEVTLATGQDYGSFATLNGVPLAMDFITNADITAGARRVYGQSCLTESNTLYDVRYPGNLTHFTESLALSLCILATSQSWQIRRVIVLPAFQSQLLHIEPDEDSPAMLSCDFVKLVGYLDIQIDLLYGCFKKRSRTMMLFLSFDRFDSANSQITKASSLTRAAGQGVGGWRGQHGEHRGGVLQSLLGAGRPPRAKPARNSGQCHFRQPQRHGSHGQGDCGGK